MGTSNNNGKKRIWSRIWASTVIFVATLLLPSLLSSTVLDQLEGGPGLTLLSIWVVAFITPAIVAVGLIWGTTSREGLERGALFGGIFGFLGIGLGPVLGSFIYFITHADLGAETRQVAVAINATPMLILIGVVSGALIGAASSGQIGELSLG